MRQAGPPGRCRLGLAAAALLLWFCVPPVARAQGFVPTGNLQQARGDQVAVTLQEGRVLLAGGSSAENPDNTAEIYDPATGTFSAAGSYAGLAAYTQAALLPDGKVLFIRADATAAASLIYDPATGGFAAGADLPKPITVPVLVTLADGRILVTGIARGCTPGGCNDPVEIYDEATGDFTIHGQLQIARGGSTATLLPSGKILLAGGFDANSPASTPSASAELYDPSTGAATLTPPLGEPRADAGAVRLADGDVLICGGAGLVYLATCEVYNSKADTFSYTNGDMTLARFAPALLPLSDGDVLVADSPNGETPNLEIYDPALETFSAAGNFNTDRMDYSSTLLADGNVLFAGGYLPNTGRLSQHPALDSAELYTPPPLTPDFALIAPKTFAGQTFVTISSGTTATFNISAIASNGFTSTIALSCADTGSASCSFGTDSIAPGEATTVTVQGLDTSHAGLLRFQVVGASGNLTRSLALAVYIEPPAPTLAPNTILSFGDEAVGSTSASQTVKLTNSGEGLLFVNSITVEGDFAQTNDCPGSLANVGGPFCTITITFRPTTTGNRTGQLDINDNGPFSPQTVPLTGIGTAPPGPSVRLQPDTLAFPATTVGESSAAQTLTLANIGTAALNLSAIAASGDFVATNNCGPTLAAGANCTVTVIFKPTVSGSRSGTLAVTDNAPDSPQSAALTGSGADPAPAIAISPASLNFAATTVGDTSGAQAVSVTNTGSADLTFSAIAASGDFAQSNTCGATLAAGKSCTVAVTFTPTAPGSRAGTLTFTDNATGSPQAVALSGAAAAAPAAVAAAVTLTPASLSFADQATGTASAPQTITLTSSGAAALTIAAIGISGDFAQTNNCPAMLDADQNCAITITFTPTASGSRTGTLSISDNAPNSPQTAALAGNGVSAPTASSEVTLQPASGASTSATVAAGQTATYNLALAPAGGFTGAVTLTCSGAPTAAACTPAPASVTLGAAPVAVAVNVTTTAGAAALPPAPPARRGPLAPRRWLFLVSALLAAMLLLARRQRAQTWRRAWMLGALETGLLLALAGCGGASAPAARPVAGSTPAGTYTLTLTASSSGAAIGSTQLTLIVH